MSKGERRSEMIDLSTKLNDDIGVASDKMPSNASDRSTSAIDVDASVGSSVQERFEKFFQEREGEKRALYVRVVRTGILMFTIGIFGGIVWQAVQNFADVNAHSGLIILTVVFFFTSAMFAATGLGFFTIVPTDEIDLDKEISLNPWIGHFLTVFVVVILVLFGGIFCRFPPYTGFLSFFAAIYVLMIYIEPEWTWNLPLSTRILFACNVAFFCYWSNYSLYAIAPEFVAQNCINIGSQCKDSAVVTRMHLIQEHATIARPYWAFISLLYLIFHALSVRYSYKCWIKNKEGWRTRSFYGLLYCAVTVSGINLCLIDTAKLSFPGQLYDNGISLVPINLIVGIAILIPISGIIFIGPSRAFTLLARYYEFNVERMQLDGAFMAELAAASDVIDKKTMTRWVSRSSPEWTFDLSEEIYINRRFWLKGEMSQIESFPHEIKMKLAVDIDYNLSRKWQARYDKELCTFVDYADKNDKDMKTKNNDQFLEMNFSDNPNATIKGKHVYLDEKITMSENNRHSLLDWARLNLRVFHFDLFYDELLLKSPRELTDDLEKTKIYNLSAKIDVKYHHEKIDYFMSHSWSDDKILKIKELKRFAKTFHSENERQVTLWFDKCCIDQRDPGNCLLVLPINIGACKNMLVVVGETYMQRLWCVWEMFILFTFCHKELALDRIEVLPLIPIPDVIKQFENFDLNHAHCFSPNEEYKLRSIIGQVGVERFEMCVMKMTKILSKKLTQPKLSSKKHTLTQTAESDTK